MRNWRSLSWPDSLRAWRKAEVGYQDAAGELLGLTRIQACNLELGKAYLWEEQRAKLIKFGFTPRNLPRPGFKPISRDGDYEIGVMQIPLKAARKLQRLEADGYKPHDDFRRLVLWFLSKEGGEQTKVAADEMAIEVMNHQIYKDAVA